MDPSKPKSNKLVAELAGGGWRPLDWSPDDAKLLVLEYLSVNKSNLYVLDIQSGKKEMITPADQPVAYGSARFSKQRTNCGLQPIATASSNAWVVGTSSNNASPLSRATSTGMWKALSSRPMDRSWPSPRTKQVSLNSILWIRPAINVRQLTTCRKASSHWVIGTRVVPSWPSVSALHRAHPMSIRSMPLRQSQRAGQKVSWRVSR